MVFMLSTVLISTLISSNTSSHTVSRPSWDLCYSASYLPFTLALYYNLAQKRENTQNGEETNCLMVINMNSTVTDSKKVS